MEDPYRKLSRSEASDAVTRLGWRLVLGELRTEVRTGSLALAADVAARVATVPGAEGHLRLDVRADRVLLSLQTATAAWVTERDVELARNISTVVDETRLDTVSGVGLDEVGGDGVGGDGSVGGDGDGSMDADGEGGRYGGVGPEGDIDGDGEGGRYGGVGPEGDIDGSGGGGER